MSDEFALWQIYGGLQLFHKDFPSLIRAQLHILKAFC